MERTVAAAAAAAILVKGASFPGGSEVAALEGISINTTRLIWLLPTRNQSVADRCCRLLVALPVFEWVRQQFSLQLQVGKLFDVRPTCLQCFMFSSKLLLVGAC